MNHRRRRRRAANNRRADRAPLRSYAGSAARAGRSALGPERKKSPPPRGRCRAAAVLPTVAGGTRHGGGERSDAIWTSWRRRAWPAVRRTWKRGGEPEGEDEWSKKSILKKNKCMPADDIFRSDKQSCAPQPWPNYVLLYSESDKQLKGLKNSESDKPSSRLQTIEGLDGLACWKRGHFLDRWWRRKFWLRIRWGNQSKNNLSKAP